MKQSFSLEGHEQVEFSHLGMIQDIVQALETRDDERLWEAARRAESPAFFYEQLRAQVGNKVIPATIPGLKDRRRTEYQCSLLLVPVILEARDRVLIENSKLLSPVIPQIRNWLQEWLGPHCRVTIYQCLFDYAHVSMWTPSLMRSRLTRLVDQKGHDPVGPAAHPCGLPDDSPALAFLAAAVMQAGEWPTLPPLDAGADFQLQARIAGAFQIARPNLDGQSANVMVPAFASDAIASGLDAWISRIAATCGLSRWDVRQSDQDVVMLELEVGEHPPTMAAIPMRAHQLGLQGLEGRLKHVAALGSTCLTRPQ